MPDGPDVDGLPLPQRYWAMLTVTLAVTMAVLDGAIANVALPTIAVDVRATPADSVWVVNAYQLAVTISLLPLASLGENSHPPKIASYLARDGPIPRSPSGG